MTDLIKKFLFVLILPLAFSGASSQENYIEPRTETFFEKLSNYETEDVSVLFDESFLKQVPKSQIESILKNFEDNYGEYEKVEIEDDGSLKIHYEKAVMPGRIGFTNEGKVSTLWYGPPVLRDDSIEKIESEFAELEGEVSLCVRKDGVEILAINEDERLAIGSTFKLFVLKGLINAIGGGKFRWDQVHYVPEDAKSLPSGILQDWPENQPATTMTLANLMISQSDNTATDFLIDQIGRDELNKLVPPENIPLLKTIEMFKLKCTDQVDPDAYLDADFEMRKQILVDLASIPKDEIDLSYLSSPRMIDKIEWFASSSELCRLIESLYEVVCLEINPGLANKDDWYFVGYKGGSEPGVLNHTYLLQKTDVSPLISISATVNDTEKFVDDDKFNELISRLITELRK